MNSVRLVITEQYAVDLAHEASVTAHLASHRANTKDAHKKASEDHKIAYGRFENLKNLSDIPTDRVEFYTGPFADEYEKGNGISSFEKYKNASEIVISNKIEINAGHDLDHLNLRLFNKLPGLQEVSIGHRLISYSLQVGLQTTIQLYLKTLGEVV
jgi:pyridoxine 5'-phosphate synthase PdxJ